MWYLVLSRSLPDQKENKQLHLPEHRQWLEDQHRSGRVLFSGPTSDRSFGIYVVLAASLSEAKTLAAQDPDHIRGIGSMEVLEWNAHRAFRLDGPAIADIERLATEPGNKK
jgi:uncharacterized protein YciI